MVLLFFVKVKTEKGHLNVASLFLLLCLLLLIVFTVFNCVGGHVYDSILPSRLYERNDVHNLSFLQSKFCRLLIFLRHIHCANAPFRGHVEL